ncbi:hypothetical protein [Aeromonas veronii]|uniref:hypothetical protein n=1 Tax=Aeromonas veronii TaxID=654 RepID=UPI003BA359FF
MRTFKISKPAKAALQDKTVYAVRDPNALFRYFGKENCTEIRAESAYLQQLRKHTSIVPMLYSVKGAHVIDDLAAVFIRGLCACFEGNTLFVYDTANNAYVNEVIEVNQHQYVVLRASVDAVQAVEIQRNSYTKTELFNLLRKLHKVQLETIELKNYTVLGHFIQQKHWR